MESPLYVVEREFPAPVQRLWQAWTDAREIEQWYSPTDLSVVPGSVVSEAVVGGEWAVGVDVPEYGFVAWFHGRYTEVDEPRRLVHTLHYTQDRAEFEARDESAGHHVVSVDLEPRGNRSWARWSQFGEMDPAQVPATKAGMESYFDSLGAHLT